ncbi:tetratricopeptide repeat protein [Cytophagaceae bacterium YF14B1]|uniref:Tetratricopeptide repeat protein n=1 Tax=Xanthocytophaga flava TaxID=3048013 RepID=A0AAE3QLZ6_9BACT|nr:tetratricopeptide repeat protein [Xanthocytophaga flavus]MDJ1481395.1 tetratricopeptide repeat protein [Xanthocytophaga flavus]
MRKFIFVFMGMLAMMLVGQKGTAQTINEGLNYLDLDKFASAGNVFKTLVKNKPTGENNFYLGYYYIQVGELDSAKAQFEKGVAADPKNGLSYVGLGSLLLKQGKKAEAKAQFDQAKAITKSKNADVFYRIGEAYVSYEGNTDPVEAVTNAEQALKLNKNLADAYVVIGDAALQKLDGTTAANNYDKAIGLNPKLLKTHVRLGNLFVRSKNLNAAREKYNEAIAADANYAPAYRELADLYYLARQYDKALENMEKYISLADKSPANQFRYAGFLILVEKYQQSLDILATLKNQYSNSAVYNRLMGYASYETNQCPQGLEYLNKYFTLVKPEGILGSDYEYLGKLEICNGGDTTKALENIVKGAKIDTNRVAGLRDVAQKFFDGKAYVKSAEAIQQYIASPGKKVNANDYYLSGLANYYANDFVKADSAFSTMITLLEGPKQIIGYQWRAKTRAKEDADGTQGIAESDYQKFFELVDAEADKTKYKREVSNGYFYLAILNLKKYKDLAKAHEYANKMLALDPADKRAKNVLTFTQKDLDPKAAAPAKATTSKPQPKTK